MLSGGENFTNIFSNLSKVVSRNKNGENGDITLTIEPSVQSYLETKLEETSNKWKTDLAGGIIINPHNGEIYALGVYPNFDPNNFKDEKNALFGNPFAESVYEMGSIIKAITMSVGLDSGAITAETVYDDTGSLVLDGRKISNYDDKARGKTNMQEILNQSLNMGAAFVERQIGNEKFARYLLNLGLGEETGIDLASDDGSSMDNDLGFIGYCAYLFPGL